MTLKRRTILWANFFVPTFVFQPQLLQQTQMKVHCSWSSTERRREKPQTVSCSERTNELTEKQLRRKIHFKQQKYFHIFLY